MPSLVGGGAEKALINLLENLDSERYVIHLLVAEEKGIYLDQIPDHVKRYFLFSGNLQKKIIIELHRRFGISWPFRMFTRRTIPGKFHIGISFLDSVYSDMLLFLRHQLERSAVVLHSSYKTNKNKSKFIKGAYKERLIQRYSRVNTIIGVSGDVVDEFTQLLGHYQDIRVINNPIPREEIIDKSIAFTPEFNKDLVNIVAVGSLLPVKGYDRLVEACSRVRETGRKFHLRILGKGPLETQLKAQVEERNLAEQVSLMGFQSNPYPYMLHSDIFAMSSHAEGLPTVLCEAMILGKPVVVTDCSGCRGLVENGKYGYMTDNTVESLTEGLARMIDDADLREKYSKKALERSRSFDVDKAVAEYEALFNREGKTEIRRRDVQLSQ